MSARVFALFTASRLPAYLLFKNPFIRPLRLVPGFIPSLISHSYFSGMSNSENNDATTVQQNELVAAAAPVPASAEMTTTLDVNIETISEAGQDQGSGESASKRVRVKIDKEDTSSYIGAKRSKVRGNIRGADK